MANVWNPYTRHSVVFIPGRRQMLVSFPKPDGSPGPYTAYTVKAGKPAPGAPGEDAGDQEEGRS